MRGDNEICRMGLRSPLSSRSVQRSRVMRYLATCVNDVGPAGGVPGRGRTWGDCFLPILYAERCNLRPAVPSVKLLALFGTNYRERRLRSRRRSLPGGPPGGIG